MRFPLVRLSALALMVCVLQDAALGAALPELDPTFGEGAGYVRLGARHGDNGGGALLQQSDGKYVVLGWAAGAEAHELTVTRLLSTGERDTSFGEGGVRALPLLEAAETSDIGAIALQADGKILCCTADAGDLVVQRLLATGALDVTFADAGTARISGTQYSYARAMLVQPDGNILIAGWAFPFGFVVRLTPEGLPDPTWDGDGLRLIQAAAYSTQLYGMVLLGGAPLVVGEGRASAASYSAATIVKLTSTGAYDTSFSSDGIAVIPTPIHSGLRSVALQTSLVSPTKIVVAGHAIQAGNSSDFLVARVALDGTLDATFNSGGVLMQPVAPGASYNDAASSVRVLYSGPVASRILVAGNSDVPATLPEFAAMKLLLSGALDTTFDGDGILTPTTSQGFGSAEAMMLSGTRMVVVGNGFRSTSGYEWDLVISRHYYSDGSVDTTFLHTGWRFDDTERARAATRSLALDGEGRVLLGSVDYGKTGMPAIRRLLADGRPDSAFGSCGIQDSLGWIDCEAGVQDLALQPSGHIVAVGRKSNYVDVRSSGFVARLLPNGFRDQDFFDAGTVTWAPGYSDTLNSVTLLPDGRMLAVGTAWVSGGESRLIVLQVAADGFPDPSFGPDANGILRLGASGYVDLSGTDVVRLADGRIVITARARQTAGGPYRVLVYRLLGNGALDPAWSGFGRSVISFGAQSAFPAKVALTADDEVVVAGDLTGADAGPFVLRLLPNGSPDSTFDGDGIAHWTPRLLGEYVSDLVVRPSGHLVVAGTSVWSNSPARAVPMLTRLTPDGALDAMFGSGGKLELPVESAGVGGAAAVAFDAQQRAVVGATLRHQFAAIRLLPEVLPTAVDGPGPGPARLHLGAAAPNPARLATAITLALPRAGEFQVTVLDVTGRRVRALANGMGTAGSHTLHWDGRDDFGKRVAPGLYLVQARAGADRATSRVVLIP